MFVQKYLQRLGISEVPGLSKEALDQLAYAHQLNIPFEDIDIYDLHLPVPLDLTALEAKILDRNRGGYCFELNALLCALLQRLGFRAWGIPARVVDLGQLSDTVNHRANMVELPEGRFVIDVGLGGAMPPFAVPLDGTRCQQRGEVYWVEPAEEFGAVWFWLKRLRGKGLLDDVGKSRAQVPVMLFGIEEMPDEECQRISDQLSQGPEAPFRFERLVNLRTPHGYRAITNDTYICVENGVKETLPVADNLYDLLWERFGIDVNR